MDSAIIMPQLSVIWLEMDSYETLKDTKAKIKTNLLEVDGPDKEPSPSYTSLIIIDEEKDDLDVLMDEGNW